MYRNKSQPKPVKKFVMPDNRSSSSNDSGSCFSEDSLDITYSHSVDCGDVLKTLNCPTKQMSKSLPKNSVRLKKPKTKEIKIDNLPGVQFVLE